MTSLPEPLSRDAALAYLLERIDYERAPRFPYRSRTLWLERMNQLLARLDNPHRCYPVVHVAGTKGKGSTSAMIAAILSAAGYRTGLYTSPHLEQIEERMMVDGQPCSGAEFAELIRDVGRIVDAMDAQPGRNGRSQQPVTYFEITTAAAMLHFARRAVDCAVLEVGLGGRLDATNVCQPAVAVITSISFDHTRQLGNTLAAIAGEKAGIIKPGVPVVSGVTAPEPSAVIRSRAHEHGCTCYEIDTDFRIHYRGLHLEPPAAAPQPGRIMTCFDFADSKGACYQGLRTGLLGQHQAANAGVAIATIHRLREQGWHVPAAAICEAFDKLHVPARTEVAQMYPPVVVDAAHNVASVEALVEVLDQAFPEVPGRILVFGTSCDKDVAGMLRCLLRRFDTVILTRYLNNPRYVEPADLLELAHRIAAEDAGVACRIVVEPCPAAAWSAAEMLASGEKLICVTGSFFLAAEIRALAQRPVGAVMDAF